MKSNFQLAISAMVLVLVFASCTNPVSHDSNQQIKEYGDFSGKALYMNCEDNSGILISVEKSDGLRTGSVTSSNIQGRMIRSVATTTMTAADGSYTVKGLEVGTWTVYASSTASKEKAVWINITVEAGKTVTVEDLNLTAVGDVSGTIQIDGAVTGNLGFLVFIAGTSYMAMTDDSGLFTISDVPVKSGGYSVIVSKGNFLTAYGTATVTAGETYDLGIKSIDSTDIEALTNSIVWKGSLAAAPADPRINWAYYNTVDKISYIYDGTEWQILAQDGSDGSDGASGAEGFYTVAFDSNGGTTVSSMLTNLVGDEILSIAKYGYALEAWYSTPDFQPSSRISFPYTPTAATTLYARWFPATDGLKYTLHSDGTYSVAKGAVDPSGDLFIPGYWHGIPVTLIEDDAFFTCTEITSITIQTGVATIGVSAFSFCFGVSNLTIPNSVTTIGLQAFAGTSITSVAIPNSVITIELGAFNGTTLTTVTIPNSVTTIGGYAFYGEDLLTMYFDSLIPPSVGPSIAPASTSIYVPAESVNAYKAAEGWSDYADQIFSQ